jgi:hypothetical protein
MFLLVFGYETVDYAQSLIYQILAAGGGRMLRDQVPRLDKIKKMAKR